MPVELPRVTYSNLGDDFSPLHAHLDALLPEFEAKTLGRDWAAPFATGPLEAIASPIDSNIALGRCPISTPSDIKAAITSARSGAKAWNGAGLEERLAFAKRWKTVLNEENTYLASPRSTRSGNRVWRRSARPRNASTWSTTTPPS